jgi:hypothetical protein
MKIVFSSVILIFFWDSYYNTPANLSIQQQQQQTYSNQQFLTLNPQPQKKKKTCAIIVTMNKSKKKKHKQNYPTIINIDDGLAITFDGNKKKVLP